MAHEGETRSGRCLCGAVRFKAQLKNAEVGACHCSMCRRWSGGVFMVVECTTATFEDDAPVGVYRSSDYGERVFCKECGSTLVWRMQDGSSAAVSVQAFDDQSGFAFENEIFIDEKPGFYDFANHTRKMTGDQFVTAITGGNA